MDRTEVPKLWAPGLGFSLIVLFKRGITLPETQKIPRQNPGLLITAETGEFSISEDLTRLFFSLF